MCKGSNCVCTTTTTSATSAQISRPFLSSKPIAIMTLSPPRDVAPPNLHDAADAEPCDRGSDYRRVASTEASSTAAYAHAALVPRTIHACAIAVSANFPQPCINTLGSNLSGFVGSPPTTDADEYLDADVDALVVAEAMLEIEHNTAKEIMHRMDDLLPFSMDCAFSDNLATFLVNVLMLKAQVKSQEHIPLELLYKMVFRLNRLMHARALIDTTLVDCEHLLGRAVEDMAIGA